MKTELEIANERILELEEQVKKLSSNSVLSEVLPVPRKCKYCNCEVTLVGDDEGCYANPNRQNL